jgi:hypothetical protein
MASRRFYAYYIRGSQLALVEHDSASGDGLNYTGTDINDIGPSGGLQWKSPVASITDGLEIEYAYSPRYLTPSKGIDSANADIYHTYNCWFVVDGYLTLGASGVSFSNFSSIAVDSYILIEGSERWNGIHKVKAIQNISNTAHGGIQTYTKVNQATKYFTESSVTFTTSETITGVDAEFDDIFSASPSSNEYMWIAGSDAGFGFNNGLYSGWSFSSTTLTFSSATFYYIGNNTETTGTPNWDASSDPSVTIYMYEAFRENGSAKFYSGVDVMDDESDTIDLPEYLAKGLVYYVQGKLAEDQGDIERKEYFMREFRRILEKHESSKIWGARQLAVGPHGIR